LNGTCDCLVISPHLHDAVLSVGATLHCMLEPLVVTVFAGSAEAPVSPSSRDRGEGERRSQLANVGTRRDEDLAALDALGASARHLGFLEDSLRSRFRLHETSGSTDLFSSVRQELASIVASRAPARLLVPVGLLEIDHMIASAAALSAWLTDRPCELWAYGDQPHAAANPGMLRGRLHDLRASAVRVEQCVRPSDRTAKINAVSRYDSQIDAFTLAFPNWKPTILAEELIWELSYKASLGQLPAQAARLRR
jgi:LmbE family N-acetylglucosaminyl deacetylase